MLGCAADWNGESWTEKRRLTLDSGLRMGEDDEHR